MRVLSLAMAFVAALALPVHAQDDDRGRLIRFLESQLSDGANRQVRIEGFRGALSSEASLDRLSISDAEGEWLILENARLNWRRTALLRGVLDVTALTAERLTVTRPPLPPEGPDLPAPEATPFALPDLPVSIRIDEIAIAEVDLGAPVIGMPASLAVSGSARLADGSGAADLVMQRLDGPAGGFTLDAGFDNATRVLDLVLLLEEEPGGLAATLLNLPDAPSTRLEISGEGPLEDIEVALSLATDGVDRVTGTLRSARADDIAAQRIDIALSGDLTPLMAAEYRPFFGSDSALSARIERDDTGATRLEDLSLSSAALTLGGEVRLDPASRPVLIDVTGRIAPPDGRARIVLPVPGADTSLAGADLAITFDAAAGETFTLTAALDALDASGLSVRDGRIGAEGRITPSASGIGGVSADLDIALSGVDHTDPALAEALGAALSLAAQADWSEGAPLRLSDVALSGAGIAASGTVTASFGDSALPVEMDLAAEVDDLSRFSGLSGQSLEGALSARLTGTAEPLSGAFDLALSGTGRDLAATPAVPADLLAGLTQLELQAARGENGLRIEALRLDGTQVFVDVAGDLSTAGGGMTATARLADLGLFLPDLSGPATIDAGIMSGAEGWTIDATASGPGGLGAQIDALVGLQGGRLAIPENGRLPVSFDVTATLGDLAPFSTLAGQRLSGALEARLSGSAEVVSREFDVALSGTARDLRAAPAVPDALFAGRTSIDLRAAGDGTGVRIESLTLDGNQLTLDASGDLSPDGTGLTATAQLADLGLFTTAVRGPARLSAEVARASQGWDVDANLSGPGGLSARAQGLVGLDGGRVDLRTNGAVPLALADRFIAPRSVNGQLAFDLAVRGTPGLDAVSGRLTTTGARLSDPSFRLALENIGLNANLSGGRVTFDGNGTVSTGGRVGLSGTVDAGGPGLPGGIDVVLDGVRLVDPTLYEILVARGDLSVTGPLAGTPRVAGRIDLGPSELRVPETGLGSAPPIPEISFVRETADERRTRAAAGLLATRGGPGGSGGGSGAVGLDIDINAPGRIFLRGRGIDAEFGGAIRIAGTSAAVIPSGQFDLIRGRISILGTRLDLTEGSATLQGDFNPFLRLRAESRAGAYRILIAVEGPASAPVISLSSDPFLPEDEILAQLLFGRSVSALSPVQLLQLADAASSLAGGRTNGGILTNLRQGLGLDDLDLQTDAEGNAAVRAGRYLSDNVYTDVTIGAGGQSALSLNIDLTPDITARGSVSSDGGSGIGVFFERDY